MPRGLCAAGGCAGQAQCCQTEGAPFHAVSFPSERLGQRVVHTLSAERHAWIQVVKGHVSLNGENMKEGDGAGISSEQELAVSGTGSVTVTYSYDAAGNRTAVVTQ